MDYTEEEITKFELDFETRLIATENVELIESYTRFKSALFDMVSNINKSL